MNKRERDPVKRPASDWNQMLGFHAQNFEVKPVLNLKFTITLLFVALASGQTTAVLRDFNETRYNEPRFLGNQMDLCVMRDYTVETADRILVLRQSTCHPNLYPALRCVIGQSLTLVEGKVGQMGVMKVNGKPAWFSVFKVAMKAQAGEPAKAAPSEPGSPAAFRPDGSLMSVTVDSSPSEAFVEVDGSPAGRTPVNVKLQKGEYTFRVFKPGFQAWTQKVSVVSGKDQSLGIALAAITK